MHLSQVHTPVIVFKIFRIIFFEFDLYLLQYLRNLRIVFISSPGYSFLLVTGGFYHVTGNGHPDARARSKDH